MWKPFKHHDIFFKVELCPIPISTHRLLFPTSCTSNLLQALDTRIPHKFIITLFPSSMLQGHVTLEHEGETLVSASFSRFASISSRYNWSGMQWIAIGPRRRMAAGQINDDTIGGVDISNYLNRCQEIVIRCDMDLQKVWFLFVITDMLEWTLVLRRDSGNKIPIQGPWWISLLEPIAPEFVVVPYKIRVVLHAEGEFAHYVEDKLTVCVLPRWIDGSGGGRSDESRIDGAYELAHMHFDKGVDLSELNDLKMGFRTTATLLPEYDPVTTLVCFARRDTSWREYGAYHSYVDLRVFTTEGCYVTLVKAHYMIQVLASNSGLNHALRDTLRVKYPLLINGVFFHVTQRVDVDWLDILSLADCCGSVRERSEKALKLLETGLLCVQNDRLDRKMPTRGTVPSATPISSAWSTDEPIVLT